MRRYLRPLAAATLLIGLAALAEAQTAPQTNPLRPSGSRAAPPPAATTAAPAAAEPEAAAPRKRRRGAASTEANAGASEATTGTETKAKRQRSPAQLANDERMRKCGAEWRAGKAQLQQQGKTWRVFNVECRARLKAQGQ